MLWAPSLACMAVCPHWQEIGIKILYKHVYLKIQSSLSFSARLLQLSTTEDGQQRLNAVSSLRVMVPGDGRDYTGRGDSSKILNRGVSALTKVLPLLTGLCTFTVMGYVGTRFNGEDDYLGSVPATTRSSGPQPDIFAQCLLALPPSVRDLSLDLSELSKVTPFESCKLCPAVRQVASKIVHLNLHLRTYCPDILNSEDTTLDPNQTDSPTSEKPQYQLQSVIVRMHGFRAKQCCQYVLNHRVRFPPFDMHSFTFNLRRAIDNGCFPFLKKFLILAKRRPSLLSSFTIQHEDCKWAVYARELVSNKTAVFPRVFLEQHKAPPRGNTYTYPPRASIRVPETCSFIDEKHWGKEYVSGCGWVRRIVEGTAGWQTFTYGPSVPGFKANVVKTLVDDGYKLKVPSMETAVEFRSTWDVSCSLWEEEEACGLSLLRARVWDGVLDDNVIQRRDMAQTLDQ